jgi:hypothetical protein
VPERSLACSRPDGFQHAGQVFANRLVWESDHPVSRHGEDGVAFCISILLLRVNSTIQLDCEAALGRAEVDDERTDWMLPAELDSI